MKKGYHGNNEFSTESKWCQLNGEYRIAIVRGLLALLQFFFLNILDSVFDSDMVM